MDIASCATPAGKALFKSRLGESKAYPTNRAAPLSEAAKKWTMSTVGCEQTLDGFAIVFEARTSTDLRTGDKRVTSR